MKEHTNSPSLCFCGGVESVTGANFLFRTQDVSMLIDCGMAQGVDVSEEFNPTEFSYNPAEIDVLIVTHAHMDHIGRIPHLVKAGFNGKIYGTEPTKALTQIMLHDALGHEEYAAQKEGRAPYFSQNEINKIIELWKVVSLHNKTQLAPDVHCTFYDAGHILGSVQAVIETGEYKVCFTGDLGNSPSPLLRDTEKIEGLTHMVMESVYGNRLHEQKHVRSLKFEKIVERTIKKNGTLLIPVFSVERTQEILKELDTLIEEKKVPEIPVYLDSPLAIKVTEVYQQYAKGFVKKEIEEEIASGDNVFGFKGLKMTPNKEESKAIFNQDGAKIILAGSGMSTGGRILFHEKHYLEDLNTTILFVGHQASGTLGRIIQDGKKKVKIYGEEITVNATVEKITGYSGHRDLYGLMEIVEPSAKTLKRVWCVMGEQSASLFLAQRIRDYIGVKGTVPEKNQCVVLAEV